MKKIVFLAMFILILGCSTCFAGENITLNEFKELVKSYGINMDNYVFPDNFVNYLNRNPVIILSNDKNYIRVFTTSSASNDVNLCFHVYNNQYILGWSLKGGYEWSSSKLYTSAYEDFYTINLTDGSFTESGMLRYGATSYRYNNTDTYIGLSYSEVQDSVTLDNFKSFDYLKNFIDNNMLFYGVDKIYYTQKDVLYKFDGVFVSNPYTDDFLPLNSSVKLNVDDLNFNFTGCSDSEYETFDNVVYNVGLQEIPPSIAVNQDNTTPWVELSDGSPLEEESIVVNSWSDEKKQKFNISFKDLIDKKMREGYIYRLSFYYTGCNSSGDRLYESAATSCFFSLNSWKSSAIDVVNIKEFFNDTSDNIVIIPDDSSNGSFNIEDGFSNINDSINNLNNNINNTILGTPNESGEREGGLLQGLLDGIVGLFVPSAEDINEWMLANEERTENSLGALSYPLGFYRRFIRTLIGADSGDLIFYLPELKIPTSEVVILEEQEFNISHYVEEYEPLKVLYNIYLVIVSGLGVWMFLQYLWTLYEGFINGHESAHQVDDALDTVDSKVPSRRFMDTYRKTQSQDLATKAYYKKGGR